MAGMGERAYTGLRVGRRSADLPRLGAGAAGAGMGYTMGTGTTFGSGCSITFSLSLSYACGSRQGFTGFAR